MTELKKYKCHKIVEAAKIVGTASGIDSATLKIKLKLETGATVSVPTSFLDKHSPSIGGYYVRYEDGYESYSPSKPFEAGYSEIQSASADETETEREIQRKGLNAPRLTPELIDSVIQQANYTIFPDSRLIFCRLTLTNGFIVTGESSCVSSANFDEEIGRNIAFKNAREKIWMLEGYLLKQRLFEGQQ